LTAERQKRQDKKDEAEHSVLRISLCNEVIRTLTFPEQCRFIRTTGYDGLEIAPFTLHEDPRQLSSEQVAELRGIARGEGVAISGLHWLMAAPAGMSITSEDDTVAAATLDFGRRLIDLCGELGGRYLVHGSPGQRVLEPGREAEGQRRAETYLAAVAEYARAAALLYIVEPLSRADTACITSVEEAVALIERIGSDALGTMIDCYAAASNGEDIPELLARWVPRGAIRHVHFNDRNKRGPGEGALAFGPILDMLRRLNYSGTSAVEPFIYEPDGPACAARAIGYLRGMLDARS
jgi:D-psicose/D-tagatose/L-ribulose 3-epimerase